MRSVQVFAIALLLCANSVSAEETEAASVKVCGLNIAAHVDGKEKGGQDLSFQTGTKIDLLINEPAEGIIGFDRDASTVSEFTDDKKTNLLQKKDGDFNPAGFGMFPRISQDGKLCIIDVSAPQVPAKGSTTLHLKGSAVLRCATAKSERVQKNAALTKGTKVALGDIELTVKATGKPDWGNDPLAVTLATTSKVDAVESLHFMKADGAEIKSSRTSAISGMGTTEWTYSLAEKAEAATIKAVLWDNMKVKAVAIDLTVGVGF